MSDIQNDQELLEDRESLKDVEAPLVDQIPTKLLKKLKDDEFAVKLEKMHTQGENIRSEWLERQKLYLAEWDEFVSPVLQGPFAESSNLHLPMAFIVAKTYHARMLQALSQVEPTAKARRPDGTDRAEIISELMKYTLSDWTNCYHGIDDVVDTWIWDWCTTGVGLLKWNWDVRYVKYVDVVTDMELGLPEFTVDEEGNEQVRQSTNMVEREKDVVKKVVDGPSLSRVNIEDLVIIGGEGDPQKADAVMQKEKLTASELWTLVDRKIFDKEAVESIIRSGPDTNHDDIKDQRASNAGVEDMYTSADLDRYEIIEAYVRADVDGSGINSELIVWFHKRTKEIVRATYLYRVNKAGERPFIKADFFKRPGQIYGMGLVEVLYPLSKELDAMHNLRIDFGIMSAMPFGFYRASSSLNPTVMQLSPGKLIPLDDPQRDVYFPNLGNRTSFGLQEEAGIQNLIERLTGVSELTLGVVSSQQGATRTATGTRAVVQEASANLDVHLKRLFSAWKKCLQYLLHMLQQRMPEDLSFRIAGDDGSDYWGYVRQRDDIAGDFDFIVDPSSARSNPAVQQEVARLILDLTGNPLDIQLGIVSPGNRYEALKNYLRSVQVKDFAKYVNKPEGVTFIMSPEEEMNRIIRGIQVPVLPQMDHEGFIQLVEEILRDDEKLGQFGEEAAATLVAQMQEHQRVVSALNEQRAQVSQLQQQVINAQTSQNQAPIGLNPLGG